MYSIARSTLTCCNCINKYNFQKIKSQVSFYKLFSTEADLLNIFDQDGPPKYENVIETDFDIYQRRVKPSQKISKKVDILIKCKQPEFNHYRNQKYDSLRPIRLASAGWKHYKSKGDFFTIQINNQNHEANSLFWNADVKSFEDLKLDPSIVEAVKNIGILKPTFVQEESIPVLLSGRNTLIAAETGCGKTLAYLLPIIQQVIKWNKECSNRSPNTPLGLIMCPSRELALQIGNIAKLLSHQLPFSCNTLIGGKTKKKMLNPEFHHVDLQISTLGVISKLTTLGLYCVSEVRHLVLDEADTMLDDSFNEHLIYYLKKFKISYKNRTDSLPDGCQLSLVSATHPTNIYKILSEFVEESSLVKIKSQRLHRVMPHVPQYFYRLGRDEKATRILSIAKNALKENIPTIIFSNRTPTCDWISLMLHENGIPALNLNGDMPLIVRMGKFKDFQEGRIMILSCTDIASRGLDTKHVKQVINYDFPLYLADYIHRCGRTGRCGSPEDCIVINFVSGDREVDQVNIIEKAVRTMNDLPNVNGNITKLIQYKSPKGIKNNLYHDDS